MEKQNTKSGIGVSGQTVILGAPAGDRKPYRTPQLREQGKLEPITAGSGNTATSPICYIP
jgi:hypothetical protein